MAIWEKSEGTCLPLDIIMCIMYFATSVKSVRDLIFSEIIYRDVPLLKMTWKKLFHVLLPICQITLCICTFFFSTFCTSVVNEQRTVHTILTAGSGYIWLLCYLFNGLHWAFLTSTSKDQKYKTLINALIVFFFIIGPFVLLVLISVSRNNLRFYKRVHPVEVVYRSLLDVVVMIVVFVSWHILYSRLKVFAGLHTINSIKRRLTVQMLLYIIFFLLCTVFFVIMIVLSFSGPRYETAGRFLFFFSEIFGTIPLVFIMLHFLYTGKPPPRPVNANSAGTAPSTTTNVSVGGASTGTGTKGMGGGGSGEEGESNNVLKAPIVHQYFQYAQVNLDVDDVGYMGQQEGYQVGYAPSDASCGVGAYSDISDGGYM